MKLLSFERAGTGSWGAVKDGKVVDLGRHFGAKYPTLRSLLAAQAVKEAADATTRLPADLALDSITFLPVIPEPAKIFALGINYAAHAAEGGAKPPEYPVVFTRYPDTLVGHKQPILKPAETEHLDWEVELAVVMGKPTRRVKAADALSYVAGYTVCNEGSVRNWQRHSQTIMSGKNWYKSGAIGPWMVTSDEIPNPSGLKLSTKVNGQVMQNSDTSNLIFDVPKLIEYLSTFSPLQAGDLILTGTPAGVGHARQPPVFLKAGDHVEQEIEKIGVLQNRVSDE